MEPVIKELKFLFTRIEPVEVESSEWLSTLASRKNRLAPYRNYAIEFEIPLQRFPFEGRTLIVFGHDLGGYFAVDENAKTVVYVNYEDDDYKLRFCNSDFGGFAECHNAFLEEVRLRIESGGNPLQAAERLERVFARYDAPALDHDDFFWPMRLYELSDCLFPLNGLRVDFYQSILDAEKPD